MTPINGSRTVGRINRTTAGLPGVPIRLTLREKANPYAGRKAKG
jgi:hypothetical protein